MVLITDKKITSIENNRAAIANDKHIASTPPISNEHETPFGIYPCELNYQ